MKKLLILVLFVLTTCTSNAQMFWNQACKFEGGTNSYIAYPNTSVLALPAAFTIECWIYPLSTGASTRYLVFKQDGPAGATYYTGINSSNKLIIGTSPGINRISSKSTIPLNKWTHIAAIFRNRFEIYINGVADTIGSPSNAHPTLSTDSLFIGKHPSGAGFHGLMDNLRMWDRALESAEILTSMRTTNIYIPGYDDIVLNLPFQRFNSTGTLFTVSDYSVQNLGVNRGVTGFDMKEKPSPYLTPNESLDLTLDQSYAVIPQNTLVDLTGAASIEAWLYMTSFTSGSAQNLLSKSPGLAPTNGYRFLISGNQKLSVGINNINYEGSYVVPLGRWVHVAFTLSGTGIGKLYANGILQDSTNIGVLPLTNSDSLYIGKKPGGGQFKGYMDELRVSKFEKTQAQIKEFLFKSIDASNQPAGDNFCFNFDGSIYASTSVLQIFQLRNNAKFSNPSTSINIPVSPLLRADDISFSNGFFIKSSDRSIPASGDMIDDSILVTNGAAISDVNLFVSLNHQRPKDLEITLISPSGHSVDVLSNYEGAVPGYMSVTTVFDDQADSTLINGRYVDIGSRIKPLNGLNTVFSGENAAGIWRLKIHDNTLNASGNLNSWGIQINNSTVGIHNISSEIPDRFSLEQNYPNPFNPVTNIKFNIPKSGFVKLKVYDILGKEVATLVDKELIAGQYRADFDGSKFSSGVYFYKLEIDGFSEIKKMMLVK